MTSKNPQGNVDVLVNVTLNPSKVDATKLNTHLESSLDDIYRNLKSNSKLKKPILLQAPEIKLGLNPVSSKFNSQNKKLEKYISSLDQTIENLGAVADSGKAPSKKIEGITAGFSAQRKAYTKLHDSLRSVSLDAPTNADYKRYNEFLQGGADFLQNKKFSSSATRKKYQDSFANVKAHIKNQKTVLADFSNELRFDKGDSGVVSTGLTKQIQAMAQQEALLAKASKSLDSENDKRISRRKKYLKKSQDIETSRLREKKTIDDLNNKRKSSNLTHEQSSQLSSAVSKERRLALQGLRSQVQEFDGLDKKKLATSKRQLKSLESKEKQHQQTLRQIRQEAKQEITLSSSRGKAAVSLSRQRQALKSLQSQRVSYNASSNKSVSQLSRLAKAQDLYHRSLINTKRVLGENNLISSKSFSNNKARLQDSLNLQKQLTKERQRLNSQLEQEKSSVKGRSQSIGKRVLSSTGGDVHSVGSEDISNVRDYLQSKLQRAKDLRNSLLSSPDSGKSAKNIARLGRVVETTGAQLSVAKDRMQNLNTAGRQVTATIKQFFRFALGYGALYQMLGAVTSLITGLTTLDKKLKSIQAISEATPKQVASARAGIKSIATDTEFDVGEIAGAAEVLAQAGVEPEDLEGSVRNVAKFASATNTSLATSADLISTMKNVFKDMSDGTIADQLTKAINISKLTGEGLKTIVSRGLQVAKAYNLGADQYLAAVTVLRNQGIKDSTVSTGLRQAILELLSPDTKTLKVLDQRYKALGEVISVEGIKKKFASFSATDNPLVSVLKEIKKLGAGGSAKGLFDRVFDTRAVNVINVLLNQLGDLDTSLAKLGQNGAATQAASTQLESLTNRMKNLGAATISLADTFLGSFVKDTAEATKNVTELVTEFEKLQLKSRASRGSGSTSDVVTGGLVGLGVAKATPLGRIASGAIGVGAGVGSAVGLTSTRSEGDGIADAAGVAVQVGAVLLMVKRVREFFGKIFKFAKPSITSLKYAVIGLSSLSKFSPVGWILTISTVLYSLYDFFKENPLEGRIEATRDIIADLQSQLDIEKQELDKLDSSSSGSIANKLKDLSRGLSEYTDNIVSILDISKDQVEKILPQLSTLGGLGIDLGSNTSKVAQQEIIEILGKNVTANQFSRLSDQSSNNASLEAKVRTNLDEFISRFSQLSIRDPNDLTTAESALVIEMSKVLSDGIDFSQSATQIADQIVTAFEKAFISASATTRNTTGELSKNVSSLAALSSQQVQGFSPIELQSDRAQLLTGVTSPDTDLTEIAALRVAYQESISALTLQLEDQIESSTNVFGVTKLSLPSQRPQDTEDKINKLRVAYQSTDLALQKLKVLQADSLQSSKEEFQSTLTSLQSLLNSTNKDVASKARLAISGVFGNSFDVGAQQFQTDTDSPFRPSSDTKQFVKKAKNIVTSTPVTSSKAAKSATGTRKVEKYQRQYVSILNSSVAQAGKAYAQAVNDLAKTSIYNKQLHALEDLEIARETEFLNNRLKKENTQERVNTNNRIVTLRAKKIDLESKRKLSALTQSRALANKELDAQQDLLDLKEAEISLSSLSTNSGSSESEALSLQLVQISKDRNLLEISRKGVTQALSVTDNKILELKSKELDQQQAITQLASRRAALDIKTKKSTRLTKEQLTTIGSGSVLSSEEIISNKKRVIADKKSRVSAINSDLKQLGISSGDEFESSKLEIEQLNDEIISLEANLKVSTSTMSQAVAAGFKWGDVRSQIQQTDSSVQSLAGNIRNNLVKAWSDVGNAISDSVVEGKSFLGTLKSIVYEIATSNAKSIIKAYLSDTFLPKKSPTQPKPSGDNPAAGTEEQPSESEGTSATPAAQSQGFFANLKSQFSTLLGNVTGGFSSIFSDLGSGLGSLLSSITGGGGGGGVGGFFSGLLSFLPGFSKGGIISGSGSPTADDKIIRVSSQEAVLNARAVRSLGANMINRLNRDAVSPVRSSSNVSNLSHPSVSVGSPNVDNTTSIINVLDPDLAKGYLESAEGERVIVNAISRNSKAIRRIIS